MKKSAFTTSSLLASAIATLLATQGTQGANGTWTSTEISNIRHPDPAQPDQDV